MARPTRPSAKTVTIRVDLPRATYQRLKLASKVDMRTTGRQVAIMLERALAERTLPAE